MGQNGEPRDPGPQRSGDAPRPSVQATNIDPASDPAGPPALAPGAVLAERFRIVRFVARGGMGELYEAEDRELGERVALKTILPSIAAHPSMLDRFRREVHLARRVTHPNVCRTYDLFHHREGASDIVFVTMEFLEGETLADLLRRKKRLTPSEALPIATQIAGGLAAAHEAGIVHRDLKAGNVLLVPGESEGRPRAVVTDFGLAVPTREEMGSASLTATGQFVGTPSYMAPEQVEGKPITKATDVYAFGIVLYEMITGALPFEGGSALAVAARRLNTEPPSPRSLLPDLDPVWDAVIVRCMKRSPEERFSSVGEVSRSLTEGTLPRGGRRGARRVLAWTVGVAAVAAISGALLLSRKEVAPPPAGSGASRPSVAVLGFRNLSEKPEVAWLSTAFSEMLTTELGAGGKLRTIPGETVARMKTDLGLPDADSYARDTLARVRSNLGTDAVVFGSFLAVGEGAGRKIRIDLRIQNASAAEAVQVASESGTEGELLDLVARAGAKLRDSLAAGTVSSADIAGTRAALPATSEAARLYAEGLSKMRLMDPIAAREVLTRAVAADPKSALAHSALSAAWSDLGYDKTAAEEAQNALSLSEGLPRESRLAIEGRLHEASREWPKAIETYRTLFGFFPDNLEHGLKLAAAQVAADDGASAMETLADLRKLPKPASEDPRIDYLEGRIEQGRGDFRRCLEIAQRVTDRAKTIGARQLAAQALGLQWNSLDHLGRPDEAWKAAIEAKEISASSGDRRGVASALQMLANSRRNQGDLRAAEDLFRQALAIDREIGNQLAVSNDLNALANLLVDMRNYDGAMKAYQEALALRRETRSVRGVAGTLGNIANLLQYQGDLEGSRRMHDGSLEIHRQLQDERGVSIELNNIAILLSLQGKFAEAQSRFDEALEIKRRLGYKSSLAFTLTSLAEMDYMRGNLTATRKSLEEAIAIRKELGEEGNLIDSQMDLSLVEIEEDRVDEAVRILTTASDALAAAKEKEREGFLRTQLALALLAKHDVAGATREIGTTRALLGKNDDPAVSLPFRTAAVQVAAAAGPRASLPPLRQEIDRVITSADKSGLVLIQLEARMARVELLAALGADAEAKVAAREVETRAQRSDSASSHDGPTRFSRPVGPETPSSRVRVGVAGWDYPDWNGVVYPSRSRSFDRLGFLARFVDVIEINSTFYRPANPRSAESWATKAEKHPGFTFTAKAHRDLTHEPEADLEESAHATKLGLTPLRGAGVLGAVLLQFPQSFHHEPESLDHLERLIEAFEGWPLVVEVRHVSWDQDEAAEWMRERKVGWCVVDQPKVGKSTAPMRPRVTSSVGYLRLHGRNRKDWFRKDAGRDARYDYLYGLEELRPVADVATELGKTAKVAYAVANNHFRGQAVVNALQLKHLIEGTTPEALRDLRFAEAAPRFLVSRSLVDEYPELAPLVRETPSRLL